MNSSIDTIRMLCEQCPNELEKNNQLLSDKMNEHRASEITLPRNTHSF